MDDTEIYEYCRPEVVYRDKNKQKYDLSVFLNHNVELFSIDLTKTFKEHKLDFDGLTQQISNDSAEIRYLFWNLWKKILIINQFVQQYTSLKKKYVLCPNDYMYFVQKDLNVCQSNMITFFHDFCVYYKFYNLRDQALKHETRQNAFKTCLRKPI